MSQSGARRLVNRAFHGRPDELSLCRRVRLPVVREPHGQPALERAVFAGDVGMGAQVVAKRKLVSEPRRVGRNEVEVVRPLAWIGLAEPVHLGGAIGGVAVAELSEAVEAGARRLQVLDTDEDVDDGLGIKSRYSSAAHVVNTAYGPIAERARERNAFLVEARRPSRVVALDPHGLVSPRRAFARDGVDLLNLIVHDTGVWRPQHSVRLEPKTPLQIAAGSVAVVADPFEESRTTGRCRQLRCLE